MNKFLKNLSVLSFGLVASAFMFGSASAQTPANFSGTYTGNGAPQFNIYSDVPNVGDESDFIRLSKSGENQYSNNVAVCDGRIDVWVYIHNGAPDGTATTENATFALNINGKTVTGIADASNAASISDAASIICDKDVEVSFVEGQIFTSSRGLVALPDPTNGPVAIGFDSANGQIPGCWEYINRIKLTLEVTSVDEPEEEIVLECNVLDLVEINKENNEYTIGVVGSITPEDAGAVVSSTIAITGPSTNASFDGPSVDYTFQNDGTYTITGTVNFEKDGEVVGSVNCVRTVSIESEKPPVVVVTEKPNEETTTIVTELPDTGAGTNIALFAAIVAAASFAYRKYAALRS